MFGCVLSQQKPSELYILSFKKRPRPSASAFFTAKNVELLGLYLMHQPCAPATSVHRCVDVSCRLSRVGVGLHAGDAIAEGDC